MLALALLRESVRSCPNLHFSARSHTPALKKTQSTDLGSTPSGTGGCLSDAFVSAASSFSMRSFSVFIFFACSFMSCSGVFAAAAFFSRPSCTVRSMPFTYCWTFFDLFLFFKPNVLSSTSFAARASLPPPPFLPDISRAA